MKNGRFLGIDIHLLSSYLGRWTTVFVFGAILLITAGALFFEGIDIAHTQITIGVAAADSAVAAVPLRALAGLVRERGCGDIRWRWLGPSDAPAGCDFYLLTSVQAARPVAAGELELALLALSRGGRRCATGTIVRLPGRAGSPIERVIFTSPWSAAGYLSPLALLDEPPRTIDFAADLGGEERVLLGVLFGAYDAGGIGLERLRAFERAGTIRPGELEIAGIGECVPEIVVAVDPDADPRIAAELVERLPAVAARMSAPLESLLGRIGIAGFAAARDEDRAALARIASRPPARGD